MAQEELKQLIDKFFDELMRKGFPSEIGDLDEALREEAQRRDQERGDGKKTEFNKWNEASGGYIEPATANVFQKILKLNKATCFDILDACASWLRAIHVAHSFIKTGMYKRVMILNCEYKHRGNHVQNNKEHSPFFINFSS